MQLPFPKVLLCSALLCATVPAFAANEWSGYQGDAAHTGYADVKSDPAKMHVQWTKSMTVDLGPKTKVYAVRTPGMIVVNHVAYLSLNAMTAPYPDSIPTPALMAVDSNTGKVKWQTIVNEEGLLAEPIYDNGKVLLPVYNFDNTTTLNSYFVESGQLDYSAPINNPFSNNMSTKLVADNGNIYGYTDGLLESINARTGKVNWSHQLDSNIDTSSFITMTDKYVVEPVHDRDAKIFGINFLDRATGKHVFEYRTDTWRNQIYPRTPVYDKNNNMIYDAYSSHANEGYMTLHAYDLATRTLKWKAPNQYGQPIVAGNEIYIIGQPAGQKGVDNFELHALDAVTGKINWTWHLPDWREFQPYTSLVATADLVFIPLGSGTVAISRKTHEVVWKTDQTGDLMISDNQLFIFDYDHGDWKLQVTAVALS